MIVLGSINEINDILQYFKPGFPRQNLETLKANECFYILNGVPIKIILPQEEHNDPV